jgi:hypothetical protein
LRTELLRRIFGSKRDEVIGGLRKLHNGKLHNVYPSPNIITEIKSRKKWAGHVALMAYDKCLQNYGWITWRENKTRKTKA